MQWTNESGGADGEDPYGGAGYAYAHGHEYGGSATADTEPLTWDPVHQAQWAYMAEHTRTVRAAPRAAGMPVHAAEPDPVTTAWDSPHGDVLTVPLPEADPSGLPVPGPNAPTRPAVRPVFVDSSGHRRRRVFRAARLLVIPAGGYVALLIGSTLGGPTVSSPFAPQPHSTHPAAPRATAPGTARSAESASPTAARKTPDPTATRSTSRPTDRPTDSATPAPAVAPTPSASTAAVTPGSTSRGRAIASSHKPVKK